MATGVNTRQGSRQLLEFAFEHAIATGRKKVTIVHKANIMKALTGIFLETGTADVRAEVQGPHRARHGHHRRLRDEAGAQPLAVRRAGHHQPVRRHPVRPGGGPGRRPGHGARAPTSARDAAIFEAVHGSAPDIAGKGIANPIALLLAAAMMLDHCKLPDLAARLRQAIDATLNVDKVRTGDLGGTASTAAFTKALVSRIRNA